MKRSQKISVIIIVMLGIIIMFYLIRNTYQNRNTEAEEIIVNIEGKSDADLKEDLKQLALKQSKAKKKLESLEKSKQEAKETKKELKQIEQSIATIKDEILEIQKKALYIGKFICKVNTCQTNPNDENYPIFLSVTKDLEDAKQALFDAQAEYDKAKKICSKDYDSEIKDTKEKLQTYLTQQEKIKEYFKSTESQ